MEPVKIFTLSVFLIYIIIFCYQLDRDEKINYPKKSPKLTDYMWYWESLNPKNKK